MHVALAAELHGHPFGHHGRDACPSSDASVSAQGSVTTWSKLMTTMPASQALLDRRVERRVGGGVDEDGVGLLADDVVERVDLRLDGAFGDLDVQVDAALERPLVDRHLGDALHLLAPVVADEVVGQIDDVGLLVLRQRRRGADRHHRGSDRCQAGTHGLQFHGFSS